MARAVAHIEGRLFCSPTSEYVYEQRQEASAAWKLLKSIGFAKDEVLAMHNDLSVNPQGIEFNPLYTEQLRKRCIQSPYDGIQYRNAYESEEGLDPTCYIVFAPNQVKTLDPVYGEDGKLVDLSSRFDANSSKFTR